MRVAVCLFLAAIPLSASSIQFSIQCYSGPTTQSPDSVSCAGPSDSASASVNGYSVNASASAGYPGFSNTTVLDYDGFTITFFGGPGYGWAQPRFQFSQYMMFGSQAAATASAGGCYDTCPWDTFPFEFGVPETFGFTLFAGASSFPDFGSAGAAATASFDGFIGFYDQYGNWLNGVTYEIDSGGQSTPEPATLLLTALAGAALLARAFHSRRQ